MINKKIISLDAEKECDKFQCSFFFFLAALGPTVCRLSLVASRGYSLVAMHRLLFTVASLAAEQKLQMHHRCSAQAQQLRRVGLAALQHIESSWARDQTGVPCIGRQTPLHCTTRGVLIHFLIHSFIHSANISMALTIYQHMAIGAQTDHAGTLPSESPLSH